MSIRKGQRVKYRVGRGWGLARVKSVGNGIVTLKTANGSEVNRTEASLAPVGEASAEAEPAVA